LNDPDILIAFIPLKMDLLLIGTQDLVGLKLEHVIDDVQEHGDISQELGGYPLAGRVYGHLTPSA
jgi:hypothetical protein